MPWGSRIRAVTMALAALASLVVSPSTAADAATMPAFDHVFVIVMENHGWSSLMGSSQAPYINSLPRSGALATNYFAVTHPSLPNYLALTGGSTFGIASDCTTCWISASNVGDNIESAGKTWKAYMESMPSPCYVGDSYPYAQKHNPFVYYNDIRTNTARCQAHDVPYSQLATDLRSTSTTPSFSFITPNMCDDMHDCSVATGDSWLQQQVPQILASPAYTTQRSLVVLTWDEDDNTGSNQVPLIMLSRSIASGTSSGLGYNHYSLLSTVEAALGAPAVNTTIASAPPMADLLQPPVTQPPPPAPALCTGVSLATSPANPGRTGSAVTMSATSSGCANPVYRFWVRDPGSRWSMVQDYSAATTHVWAQTYFTGAESLEVDVRDASETSVYDTVSNATYMVDGCTAANLTPTAGASITLTGSAACPGTPTYRFWVRAPGGAWEIVRDYSTGNTFAWAPSGTGTYSLEVDVRDQGSLEVYEIVANTTYSVP